MSLTEEQRLDWEADERADFLREQRDEAFYQFKKDNLQDLKDAFCEDNDDFNQYCREEFKQFGDD